MFRFLIGPILAFFQNISAILEQISLSIFRTRQPTDEADYSKRHWILRLLYAPFLMTRWIFLSLAHAITFPVSQLIVMSPESRRDFWWGLPSLAGILLFVTLAFTAAFRANSIESRYRGALQDSIRSQDYQKARLLCDRIIASNDVPDPNIQLTYAELLTKMNEPQRAEAIIQQLAPDTIRGDSNAHRFRAIQLVRKLGKTKDSEILKKLRWHLQNCDSTSPEVNQIWSVYYKTIGQPELSIKHLEAAAASIPQLHFSLADQNRQNGNNYDADRALKQAEEIFTRAVKTDPLNTQSRIFLASSLIRQKKFDEGEKVLENGLKIQPNALLIRAAAECYLLQHDQAVTKKAPLNEQLMFLKKALEVDVHYSPIYERLILQYCRKNTETTEEIRTLLSAAIASGKASALGHFALGNVHWFDGQKDEANWHLRQAYEMDKNFAMIGNNLAWILAHRDPPELDQAFEMIESVLEKAPDDPRFRDTLGTILMKQGKLEKAVIELERALPGLGDPIPTHQNLAEIYRKLNKPEIAEQHDKLVSDAAKKTKARLDKQRGR